MKIWVSKNSEVPVREQLVTQIILGIAGGNLPIGEKLPSTREIARRLEIHANTVSNAYQKLCEKGWIEFKQGSGFYVCERKNESLENTLDKLIAEFLQTAKNQGFTFVEIKKRLAQFLEIQSPEQILVIESDAELRKILIDEIRRATGLKVTGKSVEDFKPNADSVNSILTAMFDEKLRIQAILPSNKPCIFLQANSVANSMKGQERPGEQDLIAVVSGWEKFLILAKTVLIAVKIDAESLLVRHTRDKNWQKGLPNASMIICDSLTAQSLTNNPLVRPFRLISEQSLDELKNSVLR